MRQLHEAARLDAGAATGGGFTSADADSLNHAITYRPEVDGLRAVAVVSVIVFHLFAGLLPGGFAGVDVFFVISGYLITSIIWKEATEGRFSIARFYDRRIRRIMPALMTVVAATVVVGAVLLLPSDLAGHGKAIAATLFFVANVFFWRDTGDYFSTAAEEKPLLHMWSLGVEEQFYILFPLLLVLLAKYWPRRAVAVVAVISVLSLALNIFVNYFGGAIPAFFMLPTRAWELGAGALVALAPRPHLSDRAAGVLAVLGAVLVTINLFTPSNRPVIPAPLLAVIGTTLLIIATNRPTAFGSVLRARPMIFVGLISFSLYLWHWPVIVYLHYYLVRPLNGLEMICAAALSFALALLTWRYVERPTRDKAMRMSTLRWAAGLGSAALLAASAVLVVGDGFPQRLSPEAAVLNEAAGKHYRCPVSEYVALGQSRGCLMNLPSGDPQDADVVLLGNSHALMYAPAWRQILADRGKNGVLINVNSCLPTTTVNLDPSCLVAAQKNLDQVLALRKAQTVVIATTWEHAAGLIDANGRLAADDPGALIRALDGLIAEVEAAGKQAILIGPLAAPGWPVASELSRSIAFGRDIDKPLSKPANEFMATHRAALDHFEKRLGSRFVRADRVQCGPERCEFLVKGQSLFSDGNGHVAATALPHFVPIFDAALGRRTN